MLTATVTVYTQNPNKRNMLARILLCAVLVLPFVFGEDEPYFSHPKDRHEMVGPRIIGGEEVVPHSYPFQTALIIVKGKSKSFCGGSLISHRAVLTAAHCLEMKPDYILVGLGEHNLTDIPPMAVIMNATDYVYHKNWQPTSYQNDIGIIKLPHNVTYTEYIQPVKLATGSNKFENQRATIIGWGQTEREDLSMVLKRVNTSVMTNDACAGMNHNYKAVLKPTHICASGTGNVGVCSGDSGGPLIVNGIQVGITSFGTVDCQLSMPSVFTRVSEFEDWIKKNGADTPAALQFAVIALIGATFSYFFS